LKRELGLAATEGAGRGLSELINEPSLNIDGLRSEDVGARSRTIVPSEATATIDMRLVKGNRAAPAGRAFNRAHRKARLLHRARRTR
jgi:hypothetical protein